MAAFDTIETRSLTLVNDDGPVVTFDLIPNNEKPLPGQSRGRVGRLRIKWAGSYPAETWIEPGDEAQIVGNIVNQIGLLGLLPEPGKGRTRLTFSVTVDPQGGVANVIDSTTNDPSGSPGQRDAAPLVINAGEANGMYVVFYPSDNTMNFRDGRSGLEWGRSLYTRLISHLRRIPK